MFMKVIVGVVRSSRFVVWRGGPHTFAGEWYRAAAWVTVQVGRVSWRVWAWSSRRSPADLQIFLAWGWWFKRRFCIRGHPPLGPVYPIPALRFPLRLPGMSVSTANRRVHAWQGSDHHPGVPAGSQVGQPALPVRPDRVVRVADSTLPGRTWRGANPGTAAACHPGSTR